MRGDRVKPDLAEVETRATRSEFFLHPRTYAFIRQQAKPHKRDDAFIEERNATTNIDHAEIANKRSKTAVVFLNFKEKAIDLSEKASFVKIKEIQTKEEIEAIRLTRT